MTDSKPSLEAIKRIKDIQDSVDHTVPFKKRVAIQNEVLGEQTTAKEMVNIRESVEESKKKP